MSEPTKQSPEDKQILRNLRLMEVVEKELNQQRRDAVLNLTMFLSILSVWVLVVALWIDMGKPVSTDIMTIGVEVIAVFMLIFVLRFTRMDIRKMGVNKENIKPSLIRAVIISAIISVLLVIVKKIIKPDDPQIFYWEFFTPSYILTAMLQEFLSRGFLVTCMLGIYTTKYANHMAVVFSSLMFTTLHLYYGFGFMLGAGVLSLILGYVYLKDKNIWGVTLIHFVFGTVGTMLHVVN